MPVFATDIPTTREFADEVAMYFDPTDFASIQKAMMLFQSDYGRREEGRRAGLIRAERFRAGAVVAELLSAYGLAARSTL